jgi:hypothetical protein
MESRNRRVTTSAMLLLVALSCGCGMEAPTSSVVPATPPRAAAPSNPDYAPLRGTNTATVAAAGRARDGATGNQIVDGLYGILAGGSVEAASPMGTAFAGPDSAGLVIASLPVSRDGTVGSDASLAGIEYARIFQRASAVLAGLHAIYADAKGLHISAPNGVDLTIAGAKPLNDRATTVAAELPGSLHITGHLPGNDNGTVDVWVHGLSGIVRTGGEGSRFEISSTGLQLDGQLGGISGHITITGAAGHFSNLQTLNGLLVARELTITARDLAIHNYLQATRAEIRVDGLELPGSPSQDPKARSVTGTLIGLLDPALPFSQKGRVMMIAAEILHESPLVYDGRHPRPVSGKISMCFRSRSGQRNDWSVAYVDGQPKVAGQYPNLSGQDELVTTRGNGQLATGTVVYEDGRTADHQLEIQQTATGRNCIFRLTMRDSAGAVLAGLSGSVRPDRSLSGTWTRPLEADSGPFRISSRGELELYSSTGDLLATAKMPDGWNARI